MLCHVYYIYLSIAYSIWPISDLEPQIFREGGILQLLRKFYRKMNFRNFSLASQVDITAQVEFLSGNQSLDKYHSASVSTFLSRNQPFELFEIPFIAFHFSILSAEFKIISLTQLTVPF